MRAKLSRKAAINAFCKECIYDEVGGEGTWRMQVELCTSKKCPLYAFRPITTATIQLQADPAKARINRENSPFQ